MTIISNGSAGALSLLQSQGLLLSWDLVYFPVNWRLGSTAGNAALPDLPLV